MVSKELRLIIDRLISERDTLAETLIASERTDRTNPDFQFKKAWGKIKLNNDLPLIVLNEISGIDLFKGIDVIPVDCRGVRCEWTIAGNSDPDVRLLYIHGGAFMFGDLDTHRHLCAQLAEACQCSVLSVDYRLAPGNPYPAALEDCLDAYQWMLANGPSGAGDAKRTFMAGDSAGGNLTLTSMLKLKQLSKTLPHAAIALSPSTDETRSLGSWVTCADSDIMLGDYASGLRKGAGKESVYLQGHDPEDPLVSPLFGELEGLPPLLIQVGETECLRDESVEFARKVKRAGGM